jgi:hypothetical protein
VTGPAGISAGAVLVAEQADERGERHDADLNQQHDDGEMAHG